MFYSIEFDNIMLCVWLIYPWHDVWLMRTFRPVPHWPLAATISPGRLRSQRLSVRPWSNHVALTWQLIRLVALQVNGPVAESMDDEVSALLSDVVVAQCEASVGANLSLLRILFARSANESKQTVSIRFYSNGLVESPTPVSRSM